MSTRHISSLIGLGALAVGVFAFLYGAREPLWIRHTLGDVAAAAVVLAGVGVVWPRGALAGRLGVAVVITFGVEAIQALELVGPDAPRWQHLVFGSTFDVLDLVAYAIGLGSAVLVELGLVRRRRSTAGPRSGYAATMRSPVCTRHNDA